MEESRHEDLESELMPARHAKGAHAKRNPLGLVLSLIAVTALVVIFAPALIGVGLMVGIFSGWLSRGLTKL